MKQTTIDWGCLSRHRGQLMGVSILFIVLFHIGLPRTDAFFGLKRMGNVGVDLFFFLSGIGLWYAWCKRSETWHFYRRRLLRILPAWLVVATAFYLPDYLGPQRFSSSLPDLLGDITINWDFWIHDELTFWYIPATLLLYLLAPWYMRLVQRDAVWRWLPVLMILWCVAVQYVAPIHAAVGHIEIFWSRVPIFFIGIAMGEWVRQGRATTPATPWALVLTMAVSLALCIYLEQALHGRFPIFLERMAYIPLTISGALLMVQGISRLPARVASTLAMVGSLSLEIYLIHSHFVLTWIEPWRLGYWPTFALCLAVTLPVAWLLHYILQKVMNAWSL